MFSVPNIKGNKITIIPIIMMIVPKNLNRLGSFSGIPDFRKKSSNVGAFSVKIKYPK